jgi:hypothetical protein
MCGTPANPVSLMLLTETAEAAPVAPIDTELDVPLRVPVEITPLLVMAFPVLFDVWLIAPIVLLIALLDMLVTEIDATAPVALALTWAPLPDKDPVVTVPPVFVTEPPALLFTVCVTSPVVTPPTAALLIAVIDTDAAAPVALTDETELFPDSSPTVTVVAVLATPPELTDVC